jgi:hypothetical protein
MQDDNRPEPGTPDAFFGAAEAAQTAARKYRELAADLSELARRYVSLEAATITDPELSEPMRPALLSSRGWKWERDSALSRLQNLTLHAHSGAGVWDAQAGSWLLEGSRVIGVNLEQVPVQLAEDETGNSGDGPQ